MNYPARVHKLRSILRRRKLDGLLVGRPENRRYLSGYSAGDHSINESSGMLLICLKGTNYLLTDFRYQQKAEQETEGFDILLYPKGLIPLLSTLLPNLGLKRIGFESHYFLHSTAAKLLEMGGKKKLEFIPTEGVVENRRLIKDPDEIAIIRKSVRLNEQVFREVFQTITTDMTELDIAFQLETIMRSKGSERPSFDTIVAAGDNSALPHAVPGNRRIKVNQPLMIDMGLILDGYCSDMTRTFVVGEPDKRYLKIHRLVRRAQLAAIHHIQPGRTMKEVDSAARSIITEAGYGKNFGHALGHGVGLAVHEEPRLSSQSRRKLRPGMVVTVEPAIYLPGWGGIRLENMVIATEEGCEVLNQDTTWLDI